MPYSEMPHHVEIKSGMYFGKTHLPTIHVPCFEACSNKDRPLKSHGRRCIQKSVSHVLHHSVCDVVMCRNVRFFQRPVMHNVRHKIPARVNVHSSAHRILPSNEGFLL